MKKIIYFLFLGLIISSCSDYEDCFEDKNDAPQIKLTTNNGQEFPESFLDSLKIENKFYTLKYKVEDEEINLAIEYSCDKESTTIKHEDGKLIINPTELGEHKIQLKTMDGFGRESSHDVTIVAFDNLPPVAKLDLIEGEGMLHKYERKIDASKSFDKDEKFGGKITMYEFRVENQEFIRTPDNFMDYIFPRSGSYRISLRVQDHNGVWSETITKRFPVN